jgi:hypothetical protein
MRDAMQVSFAPDRGSEVASAVGKPSPAWASALRLMAVGAQPAQAALKPRVRVYKGRQGFSRLRVS